jgi:mannitol-1-phosphate/altronate dehydrogenase
MERIQLAEKALPEIARRGIAVPRYDRKGLVPRIVHIGLGHFHRAHQAAYLDELLNGGLTDSGIFEVNLVPDPDPATSPSGLSLAESSRAEDYLYTLITRGGGGEETVRVIGSITGYLNAAGKRDEVIARLASPLTELISLTITEKGYYYASGELDWNAAAVRHDLENPDEPETAAAYLAAALELRRKNGAGALTILSCDNFPSNGKVLKNCVLSFCKKARPDLVPWIEENVSFPLSMVDRITPASSAELVRYLEDRFGVVDHWPVCSEDFKQWVLEDAFKVRKTGDRASGKPGFDPAILSGAGVQVVQEVEPYELMKIRLLNGSHSALSYPSYLIGFRGVAEAAADPLIRRFIRDFYMEEISATLSPVPGMDIEHYKDTLIRRFANKNIADTILRLASDGSKKIPNAILKPLSEAAAGKLPRKAMIFALAAWARFLTGSGEDGAAIPLEDPNGPALSAAAKNARNDPAGFLAEAGLSESAETAGTFKSYLEEIYGKGMKAALAEFVK